MNVESGHPRSNVEMRRVWVKST